jgi:hypothetical protein
MFVIRERLYAHPVDLIELLINGWSEAGLLEAETCSTPDGVFNII